MTAAKDAAATAAAGIVAQLAAELSAKDRRPLLPNAPTPAKLFAAKGLAPLPPPTMLAVVCGLCYDPDVEVAKAAKKTIAELPEKLFKAALSGGVPAIGLAILVQLCGKQPARQRWVVLQRATPDGAIATVAATAVYEVASVIARDQQRCQRSEAIVRALEQNPNLPRAEQEALFDFLVRQNIAWVGLKSLDEAHARLTGDTGAKVSEEAARQEAAKAAAKLPGAPEPEPPAPSSVSKSSVEKAPVATEPETAAVKKEDERPLSVAQQLAGMPAGKKVAMASKGNREVRAILLRDSNKVVASAAIRNPQITESEIIATAQNRAASADVIRIIAGSKDMTRSYGVKVALVFNPKTPLPIAMALLRRLQKRDLKNVATSRGIPTPLVNLAKKLVKG